MSLRVLGWNINGLRSLKTDLREFLASLGADIICFQETKVTRDMLEESQANVEGYSSYFSFSRKRSGYSGVATYCSQRATPFAAQEGLSGLFQGELRSSDGAQTGLPAPWREEELRDLDSEGRAVITLHRMKDTDDKERDVAVINVYCPRVDPEKPERQNFKLRFYELLRQRAAATYGMDCHVIIIGDINTSHKRIDHCDPDTSEAFENRPDRQYLDNFLKPLCIDPGNNSHHNIKPAVRCEEDRNCDEVQADSSGSHQEVLKLMQQEELQLQASSTNFQVVDTFRYFYPLKKEAFTCWNVSTNSRSTNYGTRIDYVLCDEGLLPHVKDSMILQDIMGSDHCPVAVVIAGTLIPSSKLPPSCTKFFPEFRGEQQKISSYFQPRCASDEQNKVPVLSKPAPEKLQSPSKRKNYSAKGKLTHKKQCTGAQMHISSFFSVKASGCISSPEQIKHDEKSNCEEVLESSTSADAFLSQTDNANSLDSQSGEGSQDSFHGALTQSNKGDNGGCKNTSLGKNKGWGFLMKGPKPLPLCPGHKEPCVLQTVKKKGPNLHRQFYACARGVGKEGDPNARCNFFKWAS